MPGKVVAVTESPESASLAASWMRVAPSSGLRLAPSRAWVYRFHEAGISLQRLRQPPRRSSIAAALFGLDIGPFIGRPPGRLCDGLCVLDAGDHAFALIGAPTAVLQPASPESMSSSSTSAYSDSVSWNCSLTAWSFERQTPTMTVQIQNGQPR